MQDNPVTPPLLDFTNQLRHLDFLGFNLFPSSILAFALGFIVLILGILWPYGILVVSSRRLWAYIVSTRDQMKNKRMMEKMPYTVTIGIFFLVWLPFAILCIPFALIGIIGRIIAAE